MEGHTVTGEWAWLDELLDGIARTEDDGGWWPTSAGAKFGASKLAELKAAIRYNLFAPDKESWMAGWLAGARDGDRWSGLTSEAAEYAWRHREDLAEVTDKRRSETVERVNENLRADGFTIPHAGTRYEWDPDTGEWVRQ